MKNDEKALAAATEIMKLVTEYVLTSQLKAKIQLIIVRLLTEVK